MTQTPLLTWRPLAGRASYFVIVARNPSFTNLVDYGFTQIPAYAPRTSTNVTTYPDETTSYYWVVLPAVFANGDGAVGNPYLGAPSSFDKRSTPPGRLGPPARSPLARRPSAGRLPSRPVATASRSPRIPASATRSMTWSQTPAPTRATRPIRPTQFSTGGCARADQSHRHVLELRRRYAIW